MAYCPDCTCYRCKRRRSGKCVDCGNLSDTYRCEKCQKTAQARWRGDWYKRMGKLWRYNNQESKAGKG